MNFLSAKTENFKIPVKVSGVSNKTETVFGEINTDYIIETVNESGETYYVFSVIPAQSSGSDVYNLEIKSENSTAESAKVIVYQPTEDWVQNGNGNYAVFSGKADTYSLDGSLENTAMYLNGVGKCNPEPCPDCPTQSGGTGGSSGGGGPLNPGNPTSGGGMPTNCVGCNGGGSGDGGSGGGGCGSWIFSHHVYADGVYLGKIYVNGCGQSHFVAASVPRLSSPCGNSGVVVTTQETPCEKTQKMITNPKSKPAIDDLKTKSTQGGESGYKFKADGTPSNIITGDAHSVNLGDKTGYQGGYHNHTPKGIPMFSPNDIEQLLGFARAQGNYGVPSNAYLGMVAPNGMHYVIRFNGNYNAAMVTFTDDDLKKFKEDYRELKGNLTEPLLNGTMYINSDGSINNLGVEKLFFETLRNMDLIGKAILQRVDNSGTVNTIYNNNDGTITAVPCI